MVEPGAASDGEVGEPADPWEHTGDADAESEPDDELAERGGIFRRRRR